MKKLLYLILPFLLLGSCKPAVKSDDARVEETLPSADTLNDQREYLQAGYYVVDKMDKKVLLVNTEKQDDSANGGIAEYYEALWLSGDVAHVDIGQKVEFTTGIILDSYPGQATTTTLKEIPVTQPAGARLTVEQALKRAITTGEMAGHIPVVTSIRYSASEKKWKFKFKSGMTAEEFRITVTDKEDEGK